LPLTLDEVKSKGRLIADNDRYRVHDYDLGDLTVSLTELKRGQGTRGHTHSSNAEVYFFTGGRAEMEIGGEKFYVDKGVVLIPKGEFHRVQNRSRDSELAFISVFPGKRKDSNALYSRDGEGSAAARDRTTQYRGSSRIG
jgi:mannose-6-phosphate isomerase-like protein (cupin superfamily)